IGAQPARFFEQAAGIEEAAAVGHQPATLAQAPRTLAVGELRFFQVLIDGSFRRAGVRERVLQLNHLALQIRKSARVNRDRAAVSVEGFWIFPDSFVALA